MKKLFLISTVCILSGAHAADLFSAQVAYQNALNQYTAQHNRTLKLRDNLNHQQLLLKEAQEKVEKLQAELEQAEQQNNQYQETLNRLGKELDDAWEQAK